MLLAKSWAFSLAEDPDRAVPVPTPQSASSATTTRPMMRPMRLLRGGGT